MIFERKYVGYGKEVFLSEIGGTIDWKTLKATFGSIEELIIIEIGESKRINLSAWLRRRSVMFVWMIHNIGWAHFEEEQMMSSNDIEVLYSWKCNTLGWSVAYFYKFHSGLNYILGI